MHCWWQFCVSQQCTGASCIQHNRTVVSQGRTFSMTSSQWSGQGTGPDKDFTFVLKEFFRTKTNITDSDCVHFHIPMSTSPSWSIFTHAFHIQWLIHSTVSSYCQHSTNWKQSLQKYLQCRIAIQNLIYQHALDCSFWHIIELQFL